MHYNLGIHKKNIAIHFAIKFQSLQQYSYNCSDTFQSPQQYTYNCSEKFQSLCSNLNHEYFSVDLIFFFKMSGCFSKYEWNATQEKWRKLYFTIASPFTDSTARQFLSLDHCIWIKENNLSTFTLCVRMAKKNCAIFRSSEWQSILFEDMKYWDHFSWNGADFLPSFL